MSMMIDYIFNFVCYFWFFFFGCVVGEFLLFLFIILMYIGFNLVFIIIFFGFGRLMLIINIDMECKVFGLLYMIL